MSTIDIDDAYIVDDQCIPLRLVPVLPLSSYLHSLPCLTFPTSAVNDVLRQYEDVVYLHVISFY